MPTKPLEKAPQENRTRGSIGKRVLAVLLGLMPIAAVEGVLRATTTSTEAHANSTPLFVRATESEQWHIDDSLSNYFRPASFANQKPKQARRIFVLGGSTVQGRPYATETSFAKFLELWLTEERGDQDDASPVEVINCGGVSYASYRLEYILREVLRHAPDLIILYSGHNEFLEDRTDQELARYQRSLSGWLRRNLRCVDAFAKLRESNQDDTLGPLQARLDRPGGLNLYQRDPVWHQAIETQFSETLVNMIDMCDVASVPILLCVPTSDIVKTPPFKTTISPSLTTDETQRFQSLWKTITSSEEETSHRLEACKAALEIDRNHAGVHFVAGSLGKESQSMPESDWSMHLSLARDHDVCPLRATSAIEESVRRIAAERGCLWIDTPRLFQQSPVDQGESIGELAHPHWFVDHVHPTITGHRRIASAIAELLWDQPDLGPICKPSTFNDRFSNWLSTLDETYYQRGKQRLRGLQQWTQGRSGELDL